MAERRVAEVVGQARGIDQVRVTAQGRAEFPADLRALQRVGQPGAREIGLADLDYLGLGRQPPQRRAVQHPGPVPLERAAFLAAHPLTRLGRQPPGRVLAVPGPVVLDQVKLGHLLSLPPTASSATARPASSRATGTRNGEQDT